jgi:hypothetical protein
MYYYMCREIMPSLIIIMAVFISAALPSAVFWFACTGGRSLFRSFQSKAKVRYTNRSGAQLTPTTVSAALK